MTNKIFGDLYGTLRSFFRIATIGIKDVSGVLHIRNSSDTSDATVHVGGFEMPTGAASGYVLTSDVSGVGTWGVTGAALTVKEADGTPSVSNVDTINVINGTLTDNGSGEVTIGASSIDDLTDVDTSTIAPTTGQTLVWDGVSQWEPGDSSAVGSIDDLTDVDTSTTAPTDGQSLIWDDGGANWVPGTVSGGGGGTATVTKSSKQTHTTLWKKTLTGSGSFDTNDTPDIGSTDISGYDHLQIRCWLRGDVSSVADSAYIWFNNDKTTTNYQVGWGYDGALNGSARVDYPYVGEVNGVSAPSNYFSTIEITIPGYENSSDNTQITWRSGGRNAATDGIYVRHGTVNWENTDAITRVAITTDNDPTDEFIVGSWIEIIGIKNEEIVTNVTGVDVVQETATIQIREFVGEEELTADGYFTGLSGLDLSEYDYLEIEAWGTAASAISTPIFMEVNGDTSGSNYETAHIYWTDTSSSSSNETGQGGFRLTGATGPDIATGLSVAYAQFWHQVTGNHRICLSSGDRRTGGVSTGWEQRGAWTNTADAVTALRLCSLYTSEVEMAAGSGFRVFGVKTQEVVTGVSSGTLTTDTETIQVSKVLWKKTLTSTGSFNTTDTPDEGSTDLSGYSHLIIRARLRGSRSATNDYTRFWLNGDTTATNYYYAFSEAGSTVFDGAGDTSFIGSFPAATSLADEFSYTQAEILGYNDTKIKVIRWHSGARYAATSAYASNGFISWENTDPISSIILVTDNDPTDLFVAGSWMEVIGIKDLDVVTDITGIALADLTVGQLTTTTETIQISEVIWKKTLTSSDSFDTNDTPDTGSTDISGYDHLLIRGSLRGDVAAIAESTYIIFNNDTTTSNYDSALQYGGSSTGGVVFANSFIGESPGGTATTNSFSELNITVNDYESSYQKTSHFMQGHRQSASSLYTYEGVVSWESTDAITRIAIITDNDPTDQFDTGSWLEIVGVKDVEVVTAVDGIIAPTNALVVTKEEQVTRTVVGEEELTADGTFTELTGLDLSGYDWLEVEFGVRGVSGTSVIGLVPNSDRTAANYVVTRHSAGSSHSSDISTSYGNDLLYLSWLHTGSGDWDSGFAHFHHLPGNVRLMRSVYGMYQASGTYANAEVASWWENTADAITNLAIVDATGNSFLAGSWYKIIGVKTQNIVTDVSGSPSTEGDRVLIEEQVLASAAASITFSDIPDTYKYLELQYSARSDTASTVANVTIVFNSDSTSTNYERKYTTIGSDNAAIQNNNTWGRCPAASANSYDFGYTTMKIFNYKNPIKWTAAHIATVDQDSSGWSYMSYGSWRNPATVTSIQLTTTGNFIIGSEFTLYGIV